jgi:hypothetical protein
MAVPLYPSTDSLTTRLAPRNMSDYIDARVLAAGVAETVACPEGYRYVVIRGEDTYYIAKNDDAAIPSSDITDGSASELNGEGYDLQPGGDIAAVTSIGVIAPRACVVTFAYYTE